MTSTRHPDARIGADVRLPRLCILEDDVLVDHGVIFSDRGAKPTIIRAQVHIGAGAVIGDDVELGHGCVVAPGSVVLSSVPPNAVVRGNPAAIVGYTTAIAGRPSTSVRPSIAQQQGRTALGVGDAALYDMPMFSDLRGSLVVGEFDRDLPFVPQRYFLVFDVPSQELRGEHAHRRCHQFLVCLRGSCHALVDDGRQRAEVLLDSPTRGLYMPPLIWGTQYRYALETALLVFASHPYEADDYIRDYETFRKVTEDAAQ